MLHPSRQKKERKKKGGWGRERKIEKKNLACLGLGKSQAAPCSEQTSLTLCHTAGHVSHHTAVAQGSLKPLSLISLSNSAARVYSTLWREQTPGCLSSLTHHKGRFSGTFGAAAEEQREGKQTPQNHDSFCCHSWQMCCPIARPRFLQALLKVCPALLSSSPVPSALCAECLACSGE